MKNKYLLLAVFLLSFFIPSLGQNVSDAFRTESVNPTAKSFRAPVAKAAAELPDKDVYGYLVYEMGRKDFGIATFNMSDLSNVTMLYPNNTLPEEDKGLVASSGAYAAGKYYLFYGKIVDGGTIPMQLKTVDLETGEYTTVRNYTIVPSEVNVIFNDMTYDYSTSTMYAVTQGEYSSLVTVDTETGDIVKKYDLGILFGELAASYNGQLYGVTKDGEKFYKINKNTGKCTLVGETGVSQATYLQDMEFDHDSEVLYWTAQMKNGEGLLLSIDLETGKATSYGKIGGDCQFLGLYIPFSIADDDAPASVARLQANPGANAELSAVITWINPTKNYAGGDLEELTKIELYRDDVLLKTIDNPKMGQREVYQDNSISESGVYTYTVVASNSHGKGAPAGSIIFIGRDVPEQVEATLDRTVEGYGKLTWTTPAGGVNEGWIDMSTLAYKIVRYPDEKVIADKISENTFIDNTIETSGSYYYSVIPMTADGEGEAANTNRDFLGDAIEVPFSCIFEDESESNNWTVINANNDNKTWSFNEYAPVIHKDGVTGAEYKGSLNPADDWLISPPLKFVAGKNYKLEIAARSGSDFMQREDIEIYIGRDNTVESMQEFGVIAEKSIESKTIENFIVNLPVGFEEGAYYIGIRVVSEARKYLLQITGFDVKENKSGILFGTVKNNTGTVVENATVTYTTVDGSFTREVVTDENGTFEILDLQPADYNVKIVAYGYHDYMSEETVTIERGVQNTELVINHLAKYSVSGILKDPRGGTIANAYVRMKGYNTKDTYSNEEGYFEIRDIFEADGYEFSVKKLRFLEYNETLDLRADKDFGELDIKDELLNPSYLKAEEIDGEQKLSWTAPLTVQRYRTDAGVAKSQVSVNRGNSDIVVGSVYREATTLTRMTWYSYNDQFNETVNVFIIDLDENGNPSTNVLYSKYDVRNVPYSWNTYDFEEPIDCPNGFLVAISVFNGMTSLGMDDGTFSDYPFEKRTHGFGNYKYGGFRYLEDIGGMLGNLMIRAEGYPFEQEQVDTSYLKYNVYRLKSGEENTKDKWTKLSSAPLEGFEFTDNNWEGLSHGVYKYAVTAIHTGELESDGALTNRIVKDMITKVTVKVATDSENISATGAEVKLASTSNIYSGVVGEDGTVVFEEVWKDKYSLNVVLDGFNEFTATDIDFSNDNEYEYECVLNEIRHKAFNIEVEKTSNKEEFNVTWNSVNHIFDDFESYDDFVIGPTGKVAWTFVDNDGVPTLSFQGITFENNYEPMSYIIFTPSQTVPASSSITPCSGDKVLASFCAYLVQNDDYMISPELSFKKDFVMSFMTMTYYGEMYIEKYRIGYSFTGNELDDFTWSEVYEAPADWERRTYDIPAGAKYVALNCVSSDQFIFLVEDMYIGYRETMPDDNGEIIIPSYDGVVKYEVYLDGEKVGETAETQFTLTGVKDGRHTVGVRAVYGAGNSEIAEQEFVAGDIAVSDAACDSFSVYPNPAREYVNITGGFDSIEVFDISGTLVTRYGSETRSINVSDWAKGVYMFKAYSAEGTAVRKVVVE